MYDYAAASLAGLMGTPPAVGAVRQQPVLIRSPAGVDQYARANSDPARAGSITGTTDPLGRRSSYAYDTSGRLLESADHRPGDTDRIRRYGYDDNRLSETTNPLGLRTITQTFDPVHRRLPATTVTTIPAVAGGLTRTITTNTTYDSRGYIDKITSEEAGIVFAYEEHDYDDAGRLTLRKLYDKNGGTLLAEDTYVYDAMGRVTNHTDGRGATHTTTYDTAGRMTETVAAAGATHAAHIQPDPSDDPLAIEQTTTYAYYADGSLRSVTAADGSTRTRFESPVDYQTWDVTSGVSQGTSVTDLTVEQTYDAIGRLLHTEDYLRGSEATYLYEDRRVDLPTSISTTLSVGTAADAAPSSGHVMELVTRRNYSAVGEILGEQFQQRAAEIFQYDALGHLVGRTVRDTFGLRETYATDPGGNVVEHVQTVTGQGIPTQKRVHEYAYDAASERVSSRLELEGQPDRTSTTRFSAAEATVGTESVGVQRATTTTADGATIITDTDAAGRTVRRVNAWGGVMTYTYNSAGDLTKETFSDNDGRPAFDDLDDNELTVAVMPDRTINYTVDRLGRRRSTEVVGGYTTYTDYYLPGDLGGVDVAETNAHGGVTKLTLDTLGNPTRVESPDPSVSAGGLTSPRVVTGYQYQYDADAQTVTTVATSTAGGQTRVDKTIAAADGRRLVTGTDIGSNGSVALGSGFIATASHRYNDNLRLVESSDAQQNSTGYSYDDPGGTAVSAGTGGLIAVGDPRGTTASGYNSVGEVVFSRDRSDDVVRRTYDEAGRVRTEQLRVPSWSDPNSPTGSSSNTLATRRWSYDGNKVTHTDRDGRVTTTSTDFGAGTTTLENDDYAHKTLFAGDGRILAMADQTKGNEFNNGYTSIVLGYDAAGRQTTEDVRYGFSQVNLPNMRVTQTFDGPDVASRSVAYQAGSLSPMTTLSTANYTLDALGRVIGVDQSFPAPADAWTVDRTQDTLSAATRYGVHGTVDRTERFSGNLGGTPAYQTDHVYRADGRIESVVHMRGNLSVAEHRTSLTLDGRQQTARTRVYDNAGIQIATGAGTFNYDGDGTGTGITPIEGDLGLIPGFRPLDENGQVAAAQSTLGEANRLTDAVFGDEDFTSAIRYDLEGRQTFRQGSKIIPDDFNPSKEFSRERLNHDASGRLVRHVQESGSTDDLLEPLPAADRTVAVDYLYDAAGRVVLTRTTETDSGGSDSETKAFYGSGPVPEVIFDVDGTDASVDAFIAQSPTDGSVLAISGQGDLNGDPLWTLSDTGGSVRTYARVSGTQTHVRHVSFDGLGNVLPTVYQDIDGTALPTHLPTIFAGNFYQHDAGTYRTQTGFYDPQIGRLLEPTASTFGTDQYSIATDYPRDQVGAVDVTMDSGSWLTRGLGALRAGVGTVGVVSGAALTATGPGAIIGIPLYAWGSDQYYTGIVEGISGVSQQSVGSQLIKNYVGDGAMGTSLSIAYDVLPGFVAPNPGAAARGLARVLPSGSTAAKVAGRAAAYADEAVAIRNSAAASSVTATRAASQSIVSTGQKVSQAIRQGVGRITAPRYGAASRNLPSSGHLHSREAILEAFENATHTRTSQAVLDGIRSGEIRVSFRRFGGNASSGGRIYVNRTMNMDDVLSTLVHEGRHQLDKAANVIPWSNPGGAVSIFAEMRAWSSSANFAAKNGFSNSHSALNGMWRNPMGLAIDLGSSRQYFRQFGGRPSDSTLFEAIEMFGRHQ